VACQPAAKVTGTENVRSQGGLWILAEGQGEMLGRGPATTLMHLWVYDGELDAAQRVLTLNSEGPSVTGDGKMSNYQDVIEFKSDDHRTLAARVLGADGKWQQIMAADYRRKK
jgi:hypothetical protein